MNAYKGVMQLQILSPRHLVQFWNKPQTKRVASSLYLCNNFRHQIGLQSVHRVSSYEMTWHTNVSCLRISKTARYEKKCIVSIEMNVSVFSTDLFETFDASINI